MVYNKVMKEEKLCPLCHSKLWKNGSRNGHTRYRCSNKDCNYSKTENLNKKDNKYPVFLNNLNKLLKTLENNNFNPEFFKVTNDKDTKITIEKLESIENLGSFHKQCFVFYRLGNKIKYANYKDHEQLMNKKQTRNCARDKDDFNTF